MSTKLERLVWIDTQIRAGRYPNARKVQEHFELNNERVVYEDRRFMIHRLGAPIGHDRGRGGWYYTDSSWFLPSIFLNRAEITAFFLSAELLQRYLGTPFEEPIRAALDRIQRYLPEHVGYDLHVTTTGGFSFVGGSTVDTDPQLLSDLYRARQEQSQVEIFYYTADRDASTRRVVNPYYLHNVRGDWYLIAHCHVRDEPRIFLLHRIKEWRILGDRFQIQTDFSLADYLAQAFVAERGDQPVDVVIRFDAYQARWIRERRWHPSQQIEELPDGGLILRLHVGGLQEVKRWIMGYGPHAEVLEPPELREQFREEARKMAEMYKKM